jgi:hypothetical protein
MSEHRLSEIVIERPRGGMRKNSNRLKGVKKMLDRLTDEARDQGLLSPYLIKVRQKTKYFSDCLNPLRRFLRSKVGQHWDGVYGELCQDLDISTLSGQHILSHLWQYVERHVEIVDGKPCRKPYDGLFFRSFGTYRNQFYIHPETGILCEAVRSPKVIPPKSEDKIEIDRTHYYYKLDDIWYLITFAEVPAIAEVRDVVLKAYIQPETSSHTGLYAAQKRQCNKKEMQWIRSYLSKN